MPEKEVRSPVNSLYSGSKLSGNIKGSSPGARSNPSRSEDPKFDSVPPQPHHGTASRVAPCADQPAELKVTGPED
jgi:hypothetical protein